MSTARFEPHEIAFLIPTFNRPETLQIVLNSISAQTVKPGKVVVVDGGKSVEPLVQSFKDKLNVQYLHCDPPGQIRQRNFGLQHIDDSTKLVIFFDDDMELEPQGLEKLLKFWSKAPPETAGVSFNLVNMPALRGGWFRKLLFIGGEAGQVLPSGYNVSVINVEKDTETKWLQGGLTSWRRDVVREFPQAELKSKWAMGEDVRYSYPIAQKYRLFVCSEAKVYDRGPQRKYSLMREHRMHGHKEALTYLYLVDTNRRLSHAACFFMISATGILFFTKGLFGNWALLNRGLGFLQSLWTYSSYGLRRLQLKQALED